MQVMIDKKVKADSATLAKMVNIYCDDNHTKDIKSDIKRRGLLGSIDIDPASICADCGNLLMHGLIRLQNCPIDPKPRCKHCPNPCYSGEYREFVKKVMRYSGLKMIKTGRIDLIWKYLY